MAGSSRPIAAGIAVKMLWMPPSLRERQLERRDETAVYQEDKSEQSRWIL